MDPPRPKKLTIDIVFFYKWNNACAQDHELGLVNGVQNSMQNLLDLLGYILSLIISEPADFKWLVYLSVGFVGGAVVCFSTFWRESSDSSQQLRRRRPRGRKSRAGDGSDDELQANLLPSEDDSEDDLLSSSSADAGAGASLSNLSSDV